MLEMVCYFLFSLVEFLFCCLFLRLGLEVVRVCLTTATAGTLRCAIDLLLLLCLGQGGCEMGAACLGPAAVAL